jgi:hypothetical protein
MLEEQLILRPLGIEAAVAAATAGAVALALLTDCHILFLLCCNTTAITLTLPYIPA